ncbi:MAG: ABC transporter ATP-binding protein [Bacteroidota bacterium]
MTPTSTRAERRRGWRSAPQAASRGPDAPASAADAASVPLLHALGRILSLARPYAGRLVIALLLTMGATIVSLIVPLGLRELLDAVFEAGNSDLLNTLTVVLLGLFVARALLSLTGEYLLGWTGERVVADLRQRLYAHLHRLGLRFYADSRTGEITSRLTNDVSKIQSAATSSLSSLLTETISFVGAVGLMLFLNWRLSLVIFATVPAVSLLTRWAGVKLRRLARAIQDQLADTTAIAEEAIQGIRVVKAFAREPYEVARYRDGVETLFETSRRKILFSSAFWSSVGMIFMMVIVGIFWFGGREVLADRLTAGDLVAFIFYALTISRAVGTLSRLYTTYSSAAGASERLFDLLDTAPEIAEAPDALVLDRPRGAISFEGVHFAYDTEVPVLHGVHFDVEPGQLVALVGPSGAGKTTLLNLIPRFYDPTSGRITLDGIDLRALEVASLRGHISLVAQDVQLFGRSVRDNIRYGRLDATDEDVEAAAVAANADAFIAALPGGYDAEIGEDGVKLSGGQRQRLAIARALLRDPAVLLLDEATSALDAESEALVQDALARLMRGRTTFVIAHRLATVRDADRILVLDHGRVVEDGTHNALVALDGLYARLAAMQFGTGSDDAAALAVRGDGSSALPVREFPPAP